MTEPTEPTPPAEPVLVPHNPTDPHYAELLVRLHDAEPGSPESAELVAELHDEYLSVVGFGGTVAGSHYPYPLPTDPVSQGADAIRALAEAVVFPPLITAGALNNVPYGGQVITAQAVDAVPFNTNISIHSSGHAGFWSGDAGVALSIAIAGGSIITNYESNQVRALAGTWTAVSVGAVWFLPANTPGQVAITFDTSAAGTFVRAITRLDRWKV